jgi:hypothetical protein
LDECAIENGYVEGCSWPSGCFILAGIVCHPPPDLDGGKFSCTTAACKVGEVCVWYDQCTDGCQSHECMAAPSSCVADTGVPSCDCLVPDSGPAGSFLGPYSPALDCTKDDAGNPTVRSCNALGAM